MFCQKCGKDNSDGTAFCTGCGNSLSGVAAPGYQQVQHEGYPQGYQPKSKVAAVLLCILPLFFLALPVHRLYMGRVGSGVAQILIGVSFWLTIWFFVGLVPWAAIWVWGIIDMILILTGSLKDGNGYPLK